ncbi:MAG TPA: DUF3857 and transglutaminase domain-containing protein [Pyrinomonadaceae bacterium]|nr:DUF3857 and transglutaminase domain-containing protein [Pyrinomonadaceae bacterium]
MFGRFSLLLTIVFFLAFGNASATSVLPDDDIPSWLAAAQRMQIPSYPKNVKAVVLLNEQNVAVSNDGKLVSTKNYAVKILTREGKDEAVAIAYYLKSASKVTNLDAWVIRPDNTVKRYKKTDIADQISDPDDVYDEGRVKLINAEGDVDVNFIFAFTATIEETPLFYQDRFSFQDEKPTLLSRYVLTVPDGWKPVSVTFNAPEVKPVVTGNTYRWELTNLPPFPSEPYSPELYSLAPRLAISYMPQAVQQSVGKAFADWISVSRWATTLFEPQVVIDDAVAAKARELTANAPTELDKIRAIANYVQNLQYISIDIGVAYGNGYKPRPSNVVLSRGYGDCKDKANLMRAMLKVLKIEAYPVAIYSGDPNFVKAEWPSPDTFNHCIIAVKVSPETKAETVIEHPTLGRLLIFDATDPYTPVGDLPDYLQGSNALIIAGDNGGLVKMPETSPGFDRLERSIKVKLAADGGLSGTILEKAAGQTSATFRREHRSNSPSDYRKMIEGWLTRGATGASLLDLKTYDKEKDSSFDLEISFQVSRYGQLMRNDLLVFKPVIVGRRNSVVFSEPNRTNPIEFSSVALTETVSFEIPDEFLIDEIPEAVTLDAPFGSYSTKFEANGKTVTMKRSFSLKRVTLSPEKYKEVRDFFSKIADSEQTPVVLKRK